MTNQIQAIETNYRGYRFRSRTEARWAVFFDEIGMSFEYEKEGYRLRSGSYLPDFWLPNRHCWFEVKGIAPTRLELTLAQELCDGTERELLLAVGPPQHRVRNIRRILPRVGGWEYENPCDECELVDDRNGRDEIHIIGDDLPGWKWCECPYGSAKRAFDAANAARFESFERPEIIRRGQERLLREMYTSGRR